MLDQPGKLGKPDPGNRRPGAPLNGQLARAGLLDELCLTWSPWLASGDAKRILDGGPLSAAGGLRPCSVCEQDGFLFLRYRPGRAGAGPADPSGGWHA